jgi:hypothetical protein
MHPELNLAVARVQVADRLHDAERCRRVRPSGARSRSDLRTRLGRALVSVGTRLAPSHP